MPRIDHRYMTIAEASEQYRVSEWSIYRLLRDGRLTRHRREADRKIYLLVEELDRLLRPRPAD